MATVTLQALTDAWFAKVGSTNMGNGQGPRLQSGGHVISGTQWLDRFGISFGQLNADGSVSDLDDNLFPVGAVFTKALMTVSGRATHACISNGAGPKALIERTLDPDTQIVEANESGECTVTSTAPTAGKYPGSATTSTNRVFWNPTGTVGDMVADITQLWLDYIADGGRTSGPYQGGGGNFSIVVGPANSGGTDFDDTAEARRWAGNAIDVTPAQVVITYSTDHAPAAPSNLQINGKTSGSRLISTVPTNASPASASHTITGDWSDADSADQAAGPHSVLVQVATDSGFSTLLHNSDSTSGISYNATTKRWSVTRSWTETRGQTIYLRCKVTDGSLVQSAYGGGSGQTYKINSLPTATPTRPA